MLSVILPENFPYLLTKVQENEGEIIADLNVEMGSMDMLKKWRQAFEKRNGFSLKIVFTKPSSKKRIYKKYKNKSDDNSTPGEN